jgi:hypothetical protein
VSKDHLVIDPWNESSLLSVHDLAELDIPDYILGAEQARKMEDMLPLKLFSQKTLCKILDRNDPGLFFAMLPSTLLLESIHSESLSRKQRIDYLMIGASLLILYEFYKSFIIDFKDDLKEVNIHPIPNKRICFTTKWSSEYITLALSITALLYTEKTLNLGACGTHILEHYFGSIRRHSGGDNTHERFMQSMKKVFLEQYLLNELKIPREQTQRRSDSGYTVNDEKSEEPEYLLHYLLIARGLLGTFMNIPDELSCYDFVLPESKTTINSFAAKYLSFEEKYSNFISTRITGNVATGGLANCRIWGAINQMDESTKE